MNVPNTQTPALYPTKDAPAIIEKVPPHSAGYLLDTFEPSPTLLAIAGRRTRREYLGILQTIRTVERDRQFPPPPESGMLEQWLEDSKRTLRAFAPGLKDAQIEQLVSTPYSDLDPEGLAR